MRKIVAILLLFGFGALGGPATAEDSGPVFCPGGLERFLPGQYYFCESVRSAQGGDFKRALWQARLAAEWGQKAAQYALGVAYFNGDIAPVDRPLGLTWLRLAAERHDPTYEAVFVSAYQKATPQERSTSTQLWERMRGTYADDVAAKRAYRRFTREMRSLQHLAAFGGSIYIDGMAGMAIGNQYVGGSAQTATNMLQNAAMKNLGDWRGTVTVGKESPGDAPVVPAAAAGEKH